MIRESYGSLPTTRVPITNRRKPASDHFRVADHPERFGREGRFYMDAGASSTTACVDCLLLLRRAFVAIDSV